MAMVMSVEDLARRVRDALDDLPTSEALLAAATTIMHDGNAELWAHVGPDASESPARGRHPRAKCRWPI
jgi:hypothetical protein